MNHVGALLLAMRLTAPLMLAVFATTQHDLKALQWLTGWLLFRIVWHAYMAIPHHARHLAHRATSAYEVFEFFCVVRALVAATLLCASGHWLLALLWLLAEPIRSLGVSLARRHHVHRTRSAAP